MTGLSFGSTDLNLVFTPRSSSGITIDVASGTLSQANAGYPLLRGTTPLTKTGTGTLVVDAANFLAGGRFDTGQPATWNQGDFTYDGLVDILDAADFFSVGLFDTGPYAGQAQVTAVPEPRLVPVVASGMLVVHGARRRRRSSRPRPA